MASMTQLMNISWNRLRSERSAALGASHPGRRNGERGAELVELALVLPLLLVVIAGIIDFGLLFQRYEVVTNAAREGARVAILSGYKDADVQFRVNEYVNAGIEKTASSRTVVTPTKQTVTPPSGAAPFQTVTVTVAYSDSYVILGPIISLIGGNSANFGAVTLTASATMRVES
jgi:Flp pilus assembly protein TadG